MSQKLQELREKRTKLNGELKKYQKLITEAREANDGKPVLTPEQRTELEKFKKDMLEVRSLIEAEEKAADVEQFLKDEQEYEERSRRGPGGRVDPDPSDSMPGGRQSYGDRFGNDRTAIRQFAQTEQRRALAMQVWAWGGKCNDLITDEHRAALQELGTSTGGNFEIPTFETPELLELRRSLSGLSAERRAATAGTTIERIARQREQRAVAGAADKGNLAPEVTVQAFEQAMVFIGNLINACDVMVTSTGNPTTWPTANDTTNEGSQINETDAESTDSVDPAVGSFTLASYEFWSKFIRVGNQTMRDSPVQLASVIGLMIGERIARAVNRKLTNGDGNNTMTGVESSAVQGYVLAGQATYTWQDFYQLMWSVDDSYRGVGSFMMNDEIILEAMLTTDSQNRPIYIDAQDGRLARLCGRPVVPNNHMPTVAQVSTTRPAAIYGDLSKVKLRWVGNVRAGRYIEKFAEFDQTGFDGKRGADGGLLDAGGNPVKKMVSPTDP